MGLLDYVFPRKREGGSTPQDGAGREEESGAGESGAPAPALAAAEGSESGEAASTPRHGDAPHTPEPAPLPALASFPTQTDSYSSDGPLDAGLRDMFTGASVMDPQLAALMKRVEQVAADDLAAELRDFARAIGAEGAESGGRTPG